LLGAYSRVYLVDAVARELYHERSRPHRAREPEQLRPSRVIIGPTV